MFAPEKRVSVTSAVAYAVIVAACIILFLRLLPPEWVSTAPWIASHSESVRVQPATGTPPAARDSIGSAGEERAITIWWVTPAVFVTTMILVISMLALALRRRSLWIYAGALLLFGVYQIPVALTDLYPAAFSRDMAGYYLFSGLECFALIALWFGLSYLGLSSDRRARVAVWTCVIVMALLQNVKTLIPFFVVEMLIYSWAPVFLVIAVLALVKSREGFRAAPYLAIGSLGTAVFWYTGSVAIRQLGVSKVTMWVGVPWFTVGLIWMTVFIFVSIADGVVAANLEALIAKTKLSESLQRFNDSFRRFVPHEFFEYLDRESVLDVKLGDQTQREMSILFSDIRSFTVLSESMSPQENFNFLNSYLSRVGPIIRQQGGFIDKYFGDGVMGLFPTKTDHALAAAVALQREVKVYNLGRERAGYKPIAIGVGLHFGSLILGTIGEHERMDTTVIADAVNLAARLEGLTKVYGVGVLVSGAVIAGLTDPSAFHFRSLGAVIPKGKSELTEIFEVYDCDAPETIALKDRCATSFDRGITLFRAGNFSDALALFDALALEAPDDGAVAHFQRRCAELKTHGVGRPWDGVERFDSA